MIKELFEKKHINIVYVLTEPNYQLVEKFGSHDEYAVFRDEFDKANKKILNYLQKNRCNYLNMSGRIKSDNYADILHTNSRGDELIAETLLDYVME
jgi:lysophospholipase L1-like esterase